MNHHFDRSPHNLDHLAFTSGQIGRLMTLSAVPVLPGDGISLDIVGTFQLSPLRRGLIVDSQVDVVTFYQPYRHIYGDNWNSFIEEGYDETVTLGTEPAPQFGFGCVPVGSMSGAGKTIPTWLGKGYRDIWNRYFRPPTTIAERTDTLDNWTEDEQYFGLACANLKRMWTTGLNNGITASDYNVSTAGNVVSLYDLEQQKGYLRTEQEREFFNVRYAEIIEAMGGYTNISADDRPEMLMRSTFWASGYDIDGTDQASLGQYAGRVNQAFRHRVPRKHIPEHGTLWTVALMRFAPTHEEEQHFLINNPEPTYAEIAGDPEIVLREPPYALTNADVFSDGSGAVALGTIPYGQWYRYHPDNVHVQYDNLAGYPFQNTTPTQISDAVLVKATDYDDVFQTTQLGHWNGQCRVNTQVMRRLPSSAQSLLTQ